MKALWVCVLILTCLLPSRADILANSHFTEGPAHWKGDGESTVDSGGMGDPTDAPPGVVIHLKPDKWTKIYQTFTANSDLLTYTISLRLSSDYDAVSQIGNDPAWHSAFPPGLSDIPGYPGVNLQEIKGKAMAVMVMNQPDGGGTYPLKLKLNKTDPQVFTGPFVGNHFDAGNATIIIAFPPGKGSVTLSTVSLAYP